MLQCRYAVASDQHEEGLRYARRDEGYHSKVLGEADEEAAPGAELRRAHAHASAVADLIDRVGQVEHVEARGQPAPEIELVADAQVDGEIARHMTAIGCGAAGPKA